MKALNERRKKMKKKVLAAIMAGTMAMGCVPAATVLAESEDLTLRLAWVGEGQDKELLDECLASYTEQTGINVEVVFIPGSWSEYFTKMQAMIAGGDYIDVAYVAIEGFEMFVDTGMAAPMDEWIAANQEEWNVVAGDVSEATMNKMVFDGQTYAVPFEWNSIVTHFNTKLLEEAGLELPDADWGKEEFLEYCEKLTVEREDGTKQYGVQVPGGYFGMSAWLFNNGASIMNEDFTKCMLNDPKAVEVFQFAQDLIYEYGYAPIPEETVSAMQQLVDGNIAMNFVGRWATTTYNNNNFTDAAVQYVPTFSEDAENTPIWGGAGIFTMNTSEHLDEAMSFATWLGSEEFIPNYMGYGAVPVLNSVAEDLVSALGYPENCQIFWEAADTAKAVEAPAQYAECEGAVSRAISEILVNKADVQETLDAVAAEIDSYLIDNIE